MGKHALLSASSSHRWLVCPPSAKLCAEVEDKGSEYAAEGSDAHALCEYKVLKYLGKDVKTPTAALSFYDEEMECCTDDYAGTASDTGGRAGSFGGRNRGTGNPKLYGRR